MNTEHYIALLNESQKRLVEVLKDCIQKISGEVFAEKEKAIKRLLEEITHFHKILPEKSRPDWLNKLKRATNSFTVSTDKVQQMANLLQTLIETLNNVINQAWINDEISFEEIYKRNRSDSNLPELYNQLIDLLSQILLTEKIKDEIIIAGINKLINIINVNKGQSLYSDLSIIDYIIIFFKNVVVNTIKEIPVIKVIIESIEKTLEDIKHGVNKVQLKSLDEIETKTQVSINMLPKSSNRALLVETHLGNKVNLLQ